MLRGRILCPSLRARPILHQPALASPPSPPSPRWQSTAAPATTEENNIPLGNDKGHISKAENESLAFFDREFPLRLPSAGTRADISDLYPLKLTYLLSPLWKSEAQLISQFESSRLGISNPANVVRRATKGLPLKITEVIPRIKDGGAFVKFTYEGEASPAEMEGTSPYITSHGRCPTNSPQPNSPPPSRTAPINPGSTP